MSEDKKQTMACLIESKLGLLELSLTDKLKVLKFEESGMIGVMTCEEVATIMIQSFVALAHGLVIQADRLGASSLEMLRIDSEKRAKEMLDKHLEGLEKQGINNEKRSKEMFDKQLEGL
jgi:hypothetical protein